MPSAPGITEEELRDVWARWSELRPDDLDWEVSIDLRAEGQVIAGFLPTREERERPRPAHHVAKVSLGGTVNRSGFQSDDLATERRVFATWEIDSLRLAELLNALCDVFGDDEILTLVRRQPPTWEDSLVMWVWARL